MSHSFYIYICQGDAGINAVIPPTWRRSWPGESPLDAVQALQNSYSWYQGDTFLVQQVNDFNGDVGKDLHCVRIDKDGVARETIFSRGMPAN